jgi:Zn-dependent protease with chaperone function
LAVRYDLVPFTGQNLGWRDLTLVPGFLLLWTFGRVYGNLLMTSLARRQERAADLYSWELTGRAEPFITAMRKMTALNLVVFDKRSEWQYAHPPTADRIAAAEAFAKANGELVCSAIAPLAVNPQGS